MSALPQEPEPDDRYAGVTDREILVSMHRILSRIEEFVDQVIPAMQAELDQGGFVGLMGKMMGSMMGGKRG